MTEELGHGPGQENFNESIKKHSFADCAITVKGLQVVNR